LAKIAENNEHDIDPGIGDGYMYEMMNNAA
jgi:hypothetical protein